MKKIFLLLICLLMLLLVACNSDEVVYPDIDAPDDQIADVDEDNLGSYDIELKDDDERDDHIGDTKTLTEDIEFSLKNIIKGRKLGWAVDAKVYDEQPVGFTQSWKQRTRWTVGHIQCIKEYTKPLAIAVKENKTMMNFDGLLYILGSIPMFVITIILLLINSLMFLAEGMTATELFNSYINYLIPTFLLPIASAVVIMALDRRPIKPMIKGLICYPLFLGSWLLINFKCLFKRDTSWEKIKHVRSIKINEMAKIEEHI